MSVRMFISGQAIGIAGICASVVPFICQMKNYPETDSRASEGKNVLSSYFANILYMFIYLAYMIIVSDIGRKLYPGHSSCSEFNELLALAVCADMIFISCVYTIGHELNVYQRMTLGILLCNGQIGFVMLMKAVLKQFQPDNLILYCSCFCILILLLTLGFIKITYFRRVKQ